MIFKYILGKIVKTDMELNGVVLITSDHCNCEEIINKKGKKVTNDSLISEFFIILDSQYNGEYKINTTRIEEPGNAIVMVMIMNH